MKIKRLLLSACLLAAMASCKQNDSSARDLDSLMQLHDEVMVKNDNVVHLQMKLDSILKKPGALKLASPSADTSLTRKEISAHLRDLKDAEEKMNEWMYAFEPDLSKKSSEEAANYIKSERNKLTSVDSLYDITIKATNDYLNKLEKAK